MAQNLFKLERENFGAFLANKRHARGLSQGVVAKSLGYSSPQFISNFERGLCQPPADKAPKLIKLYGITKSEYIERALKIEAAKLREAFQ